MSRERVMARLQALGGPEFPGFSGRPVEPTDPERIRLTALWRLYRLIDGEEGDPVPVPAEVAALAREMLPGLNWPAGTFTAAASEPPGYVRLPTGQLVGRPNWTRLLDVAASHALGPTAEPSQDLLRRALERVVGRSLDGLFNVVSLTPAEDRHDRSAEEECGVDRVRLRFDLEHATGEMIYATWARPRIYGDRPLPADFMIGAPNDLDDRRLSGWAYIRRTTWESALAAVQGEDVATPGTTPAPSTWSNFTPGSPLTPEALRAGIDRLRSLGVVGLPAPGFAVPDANPGSPAGILQEIDRRLGIVATLHSDGDRPGVVRCVIPREHDGRQGEVVTLLREILPLGAHAVVQLAPSRITETLRRTLPHLAALNADVAQGASLDAYAQEMYGATRAGGETDQQLRDRMASMWNTLPGASAPPDYGAAMRQGIAAHEAQEAERARCTRPGCTAPRSGPALCAGHEQEANRRRLEREAREAQPKPPPPIPGAMPMDPAQPRDWSLLEIDPDQPGDAEARARYLAEEQARLSRRGRHLPKWTPPMREPAPPAERFTLLEPREEPIPVEPPRPRKEPHEGRNVRARALPPLRQDAQAPHAEGEGARREGANHRGGRGGAEDAVRRDRGLQPRERPTRDAPPRLQHPEEARPVGQPIPVVELQPGHLRMLEWAGVELRQGQN